jgi:non-specific protein-tyrosine kinase
VTLAQYLRVLRQQWWVVIALAAFGVGGAAFYTVNQQPVYSATTQLFVSVTTPDSNISQMSQGSSFIQQRVKSYAAVVASPEVLQDVIRELQLPATPGSLAGQVTVDTPLDTVLLNVTVTDSDAATAANIANEIGRMFPSFVAGLEKPDGMDVSPVKISVTKKAQAAGAPVSPRVPLNLALGLLFGLGVGIALAVLRDQLNTAVGGVGDIEKLTGAVPLGVVPFDSTASENPLVDADQQSGRAEAFRTLRTNLQFADVDNPPRVIVVTSPLPNEGKSTSACNVALTLAFGGARVVLVDGDLRAPTVGKYLGVDNSAGLSSVLAGRHELRDVIHDYGRDSTLCVLPSGPKPPNPSELLSSQHLVDLVATLANHYDVVVIDAPPLLPVTDAAVLASVADGAVLVIRHGRTRREEVQRAMQTLSAVNGKLLGTVMNFAPKRKGRGGYDGYGYGYGYGTATADEPVGGGRRSAKAESAPLPGAASTLPGAATGRGSSGSGATPSTVPPGIPAPVGVPTHALAPLNGHSTSGYAPSAGYRPAGYPAAPGYAPGHPTSHAPGYAPANGYGAATAYGAGNGYAPANGDGPANGYAPPPPGSGAQAPGYIDVDDAAAAEAAPGGRRLGRRSR